MDQDKFDSLMHGVNTTTNLNTNVKIGQQAESLKNIERLLEEQADPKLREKRLAREARDRAAAKEAKRVHSLNLRRYREISLPEWERAVEKWEQETQKEEQQYLAQQQEWQRKRLDVAHQNATLKKEAFGEEWKSLEFRTKISGVMAFLVAGYLFFGFLIIGFMLFTVPFWPVALLAWHKKSWSPISCIFTAPRSVVRKALDRLLRSAGYRESLRNLNLEELPNHPTRKYTPRPTKPDKPVEPAR